MNKPTDYTDIVAMVSFEDIPAMPAVGFTVTENDKTVFFVKICRIYVDWGRITAWRYLHDLWPNYMFREEENK